MLLNVIEKVSNKEDVISVFSNLEDYLLNFNIAKEIFDSTLVKTIHDKALLIKYYDSSLKKANTLVTDDEYVGITYDNLEIIDNIINENKLVKRI